jgi:uncharacterized protein (DUF427 family)
MATATWNRTVIATSDDVVEMDGYWYFPSESVVDGVLKDSATTSVCTFKGCASYFTLQVGGKENADAGWSYLSPPVEAALIRGRVAFWRGVVVDH